MVKRFLLLILAAVLLIGIASYAIAQNRSQDPTVDNPSPYSNRGCVVIQFLDSLL